MKRRVLEVLQKYVKDDVVLEKPKDISFGHFATPIAFTLAKKLRKSPMIIADELAKEFSKENFFEKVTPAKGYVNLKLSNSFLNEYATFALKNEDKFGKSDKRESILLEFVSANPTGPLHIGHARGAVIGDTIYKIAKHLGYKIESEYYINDAGNQIYLLGLSIYLSGRENILKEEVEWPKEFYRGDYINDLAKEASIEFGKEIFKERKNIDKLSLYGKERMLDLIKSNLKDVGIEFDNFVSEKELFPKWKKTEAILEKNDALYKKDGKIWLESTKYGDEKDRVVVREDGRPTYLAGDIIYHNDKFQRGYDKYINIWGADHHGYIARVKSAIKFLGYDENRLEVILAQMVSLLKGGEPFKMSKRAGNFILMSDVVKEIGSDALRFIFLTKKTDTHLEFDIDLLKKEDSSNPIYYINYAHARVNQIFGKANKKVEDIIDVSFETLNDDAKNLLFIALLLPEILEDVFQTKSPNKLTDYLKNLAGSLHKFYNNNRVVGSENEDALLKVLAMVATSIRVGLRLIGIEAKERM